MLPSIATLRSRMRAMDRSNGRNCWSPRTRPREGNDPFGICDDLETGIRTGQNNSERAGGDLRPGRQGLKAARRSACCRARNGRMPGGSWNPVAPCGWRRRPSAVARAKLGTSAEVARKRRYGRRGEAYPGLLKPPVETKSVTAAKLIQNWMHNAPGGIWLSDRGSLPQRCPIPDCSSRDDPDDLKWDIAPGVTARCRQQTDSNVKQIMGFTKKLQNEVLADQSTRDSPYTN
jgi:hypothetical protein